MVKVNPYSEALKAALKNVSEISNPDYVLLPIDPNPTMLLTGADIAGVDEAIMRDAYMAMVLAWTQSGSN